MVVSAKAVDIDIKEKLTKTAIALSIVSPPFRKPAMP
jgi:hypothetical protein